MKPNPLYMQQALELARAQLGQTWPNPSVGAVVVKDDMVIGIGATAKGGRPHAETIALEQAGANAKGATLYVTLEPCSHHGQTPPCAEAIIKSGISHCIIATRDPNPKVDGGGIKMLKDAGIAVTTGISKKAACEINRGFFSVIEKGRPYIALKIATSADEMIAAAPGVRTDITSIQAREHVQTLRAEFDAILTGIGTVLADDPQLNVRIQGMEHRSPQRIVLDRNHRLPESAKILPTWTYDCSLKETIADLTERGITRLLVEAGQGLNTAFLESELVDRIYWYRAPIEIGGNGLPALKNSPLSAQLGGWQQVGDVLAIGTDTLTILENPCSPA